MGFIVNILQPLVESSSLSVKYISKVPPCSGFTIALFALKIVAMAAESVRNAKRVSLSIGSSIVLLIVDMIDFS